MFMKTIVGLDSLKTYTLQRMETVGSVADGNYYHIGHDGIEGREGTAASAEESCEHQLWRREALIDVTNCERGRNTARSR